MVRMTVVVMTLIDVLLQPQEAQEVSAGTDEDLRVV